MSDISLKIPAEVCHDVIEGVNKSIMNLGRSILVILVLQYR
jgi:hypothetical protein